MKTKIALFLALLISPAAFPLEGFYLGAEIGHVAIKEKFNNTIGFGVDLGFRTNAILDVLFSSQYSSHSGGIDGLSLYSETLGANIHLFQANDFDITVGAGPGFYFFKKAFNTDSLFGIHLGAACDVMADEHIRLGLGIRYHNVFGADDVKNTYWTIMMRAGYQFGE